jgi:hypothetical protein
MILFRLMFVAYAENSRLLPPRGHNSMLRALGRFLARRSGKAEPGVRCIPNACGEVAAASLVSR